MHGSLCQLFTVLGSAGVGKSRLAAEFLAGRGDGRPWAVSFLRRGDHVLAGGRDPQAARALPEGDAARPLRSLLGETEEPASAEEIAWAFRKLLEQEARAAAGRACLDDLHWAEETLLDLVEHVADLSRDAPLLLLCMARPELLERRPSWGGGKWNATTVLLEPLDAAETELLLAELGGVPTSCGSGSSRWRRGTRSSWKRCSRSSATPGGDVEVPPTIQALLAARLDQLDPAERSVLERGSVEGGPSTAARLRRLPTATAPSTSGSSSLVRKELVRPDRAQLSGDDAYRFRHLLIRDAAYDALPKATRAELHRRFAGWLEEHGEELVELDEILGYHLEQAARYLEELGRPDPQLALAAGDRLGRCGKTRTLEEGRPCRRRLARAFAPAHPVAPLRPSPRARPCSGGSADPASGGRDRQHRR